MIGGSRDGSRRADFVRVLVIGGYGMLGRDVVAAFRREPAA